MLKAISGVHWIMLALNFTRDFFIASRKTSLVLDMMEEYRPWVVDRNVIKLRSQLNLTARLMQSSNVSLARLFTPPWADDSIQGRKLKLEVFSSDRLIDLLPQSLRVIDINPTDSGGKSYVHLQKYLVCYDIENHKTRLKFSRH